MAMYQDFDLILSKTGAQEFVAYVPDRCGGREAENAFRLVTDTLKMREDLKRLEEYSLSSEALRDDLHLQFGRLLYGCALGGDMGRLLAERSAEMAKQECGLRLRLRVESDAPELMNLPWELLHDGEGFLAMRTGLPISRLPAGIARRARTPLDRTLRMLVVVSSPLDLPSHMILNTEKEQEMIVAALDKLQRKRLIEIDFCEGASLATIQAYLSEQEYDILHFTGHGVFNEELQRGELLLENDQGNQQPVADTEFTALVRNHASLRLTVLSACQSARTTNNTAYPGMAVQLARQGTSAVLAMQYSVLDETATLFANRFYTGVANNKPIDVALAESRLALAIAARDAGRERIDFATPVLLLNDPDCVNVSQVRAPERLEAGGATDFATVSVMDRGFVGRHRELRRIRNGFLSGRQRASIIHGLGGMGKSVLATRAATRMQKSFRGVKAVRMTSTTRPEDILSELNAFLNVAGVDRLNQVLHMQAPLAAKTAVLAQILTQFPLLVLFDNCEDVLSAGKTVRDGADSGAEHSADISGIADPDLRQFFEQLVNSVAGGSRFLFTTRYDFDPARGRLTGEIDHIALGEMPFSSAVQCMNNHDILASLPVVAARSVGEGAGVAPITKHELYSRLGGHPYTIDVFARRAAVTSVADVWLEIEGVEQEMIEFTLLDRTYAQLPAVSRRLLIRSSVLAAAPSLEELQWMMGDAQASAAVDAELRPLLEWGMLSREETKESVVYPMHALVRDYAHQQLKAGGEDETGLLKRAGAFWDLQAQAATTQGDMVAYLLRSRNYYFQAGEFEKAYSATELVRDHLMRWGFTDLVMRLTQDCVRTSTGMAQAVAMRYLATLYHELGDLNAALAMHLEVLRIYRANGDEATYPPVLHEIAMNYHSLGDFQKARAYYQESQKYAQKLHQPNREQRHNWAADVYQLALLDMDEGKLESAEAGLKDAQQRSQELNDVRAQAACLRELGQIRHKKGDLETAEKQTRASLILNEQVGNRQGLGHCYALLGKILIDRKKHTEAAGALEKAIGIFDSIGLRNPKADCIYYLGRIHRDEGDYTAAIEKGLIAYSILAGTGDHNQSTVIRFLYAMLQELGKERFDPMMAAFGQKLEVVEVAQGLQVKLLAV
jgi:tetratricopeptide (TPR) repeat protein